MWIDLQDFLYTIRSARRAPLLSIIAVVALSLGIGLNAGVFTLLNALFLNPPTQRDPSRFVQSIRDTKAGSREPDNTLLSPPRTTMRFARMRRHLRTPQRGRRVRSSEEAHRSVPTLQVTCNYFHLFGNDRPLLGRFLTPQECNRGTAVQVAVFTEPFWKNQFDGNPHIVGTTIHLNGLPFTVVGIVPSGIANFSAGGVFVPYTAEPLLDHSATSPLTNPDAPWLRSRAGCGQDSRGRTPRQN